MYTIWQWSSTSSWAHYQQEFVIKHHYRNYLLHTALTNTQRLRDLNDSCAVSLTGASPEDGFPTTHTKGHHEMHFPVNSDSETENPSWDGPNVCLKNKALDYYLPTLFLFPNKHFDTCLGRELPQDSAVTCPAFLLPSGQKLPFNSCSVIIQK